MAEKISAKKLISYTLKTSITFLVVGYIIYKLGWKNILSALSQAEPLFIIIGIIIFFLSGLLGAFQWQILLKNKNINTSFYNTFKRYFIGMFFNNFMVGMVGGDAMKIALIKSGNGSGKAGFAATFLDRFAGLWAMLGFAVAGSLVLFKRGLLDQGKIGTASIALCVTFILFCFIALFLVSQRVQKLSFFILKKIPVLNNDFIYNIIKLVVMETHNRHILIPVLLLSFVIQFMRIFVHIACAISLGLLTPENFQYFFIFVPFIAILMLIPLPFGIKEGISGSLFLLAGFSPEAPQEPIVMEFLSSLIATGTSLAGGIFFIISRLSSSKEEY